MPRRRRIDDPPSAERRLGAQDHPVAAGGDDGLRQAKLRPALTDPNDASDHVRGSDVDVSPSTVADRLELVEHDVQPVRARITVSLHESVTAQRLGALDSGQAHRDPLPRLGPLDVAIVHLHAPHAHCLAGRLEQELVAGADRARPQRPRQHRPDPAQGEGAVDVEARRPLHPLLLDAVRGAPDRRPQVVDPGTRARAHRHDLRARDELLRDFHGELERLLVHGVGLGHGDDAALDPEQAEDREVLVRLWPRTLARVDDEQEEVDPGGPRHHRPHEALVARHVDHRQAAPVGQLERRVPEIDRDAATLLLGQAVRVLPGQRAHEPRLPVIDVTGSADRQRHRASINPSWM